MNTAFQNEHPRDILQRQGLSPNKQFGQNFLVPDQLLRRVVDSSNLSREHLVLEIGVGLGRLTALLAERAGRVVGVEIDRGLCRIAQQQLSTCSNVRLLCTDFLQSKHRIAPAVLQAVAEEGDGRELKVVSNLPYCISSPAIVGLLEWEFKPLDMHVMLQAEVVNRLRALPGTAEYGPLTVVAGYLADVEELFTVSASAFWPSPNVSSKFIRIVPCEYSKQADDYKTFVSVVNRLMQSRRKTLGRALSIGWGNDVRDKVLERTGLPGRIRPGKLGIGNFVEIANVIADIW
jgi:16S rRNA (adenine1518-N6/adenine1519-N6)-dimethyltransferase